MSNTIPGMTPDNLEADWERLARLDWAMSPAIPQVIQAILAAKAYSDSVLMQSHLNTVFEASRNLVHDLIQKQIGRAQFAGESWRNTRKAMALSPRENYDDLGNKLEALFISLLEGPISLRDGPISMLEQAGYEVENAAQLRRDIEELQQLREDILRDWPWSTRALPPVDRNMVAKSRAAIARNEGEGIEDLIQRLGGTPAKFD